MADRKLDLNPDEYVALGDRLKARRERQAAGTGERGETQVTRSESPVAKPTSNSLEPDMPGGLGDRLLARRERQADSTGRTGEGDGNLGQQIAREPLFVGLGIRGHHRAGQKDSEAPPVKQDATRGYEDLGAPDPQPVRSRRPRI